MKTGATFLQEVKTGATFLQEAWAETLAMVLLLAGFFVSLLLANAWLVYLVVVLTGFLAGRIFYIKRFREPIFPFILMIIGFLFGYILGSFAASRPLTTILFVISFVVSYYLHLKKILKIFKSEEFIR